MLYKNMIPNKTYSNTPTVVLPKDLKVEINGKEVPQKFIFIMLEDDLNTTIDLLSSNALSIPMKNLKVYRTFIPSKMHERIGKNMINDDLRMTVHKSYREQITSHLPWMKTVDTSTLKSVNAESSNLLYNMAPEMEYFMRYRFRRNRIMQIDDFFTFINNHIAMHFNETYQNHMRIFYVPIDTWAPKVSNGFGIGKESLDNPLSFILAAAYINEEIFNNINGEWRILVHDRTRNQSMYITKEALTRKNFSTLKRQLSLFSNFKYKEPDEDDKDIDIVPENESSNKLLPGMNTEDIKKEASKIILQDIKSKITNNFMGDSIHLSEEFEDSDDETSLSMDEEDEIEDNIARKLEEYQNQLIDDDGSINKNTIEYIANSVVSDKIKSSYMPKSKSSKEDKLIKEREERVKRLIADQNRAIVAPERAQVMKVDKLDLSNIIKSDNKKVTESYFANFDKSYMDNKLDYDLDNVVMSMNTAENRIFIKNKKVEDTSNIESQKLTYTYDLEDERGKSHTLEFDVPKLLDGGRIRINGNYKTIQKQLVLKPIVKTGSDSVVITSWYNKMYLWREGKTVNTLTSNIKKFLTTKEGLLSYKGVISNCYIKNKKYNTTLEYDAYSKSLESIKGNKKEIYFDVKLCLDALTNKGVDTSKIDLVKYLPLGYDNLSKSPILIDLDLNQSVSEYLREHVLSEEDYVKMSKKASGKGKTNSYTSVKILKKIIPLAILIMYFEGLTELCKRAKVETRFFKDKDEMKRSDFYNPITCGVLELADGIFVWKNDSTETSLLMSGLLRAPLSGYTREELDSKEYLISLVGYYYENENKYQILDQFYEFMIDQNTRMILEDLNLPTHITDLLIYGNTLLANNKSSYMYSAENCRIRSMEVIAGYAYKAVTDAYKEHRATLTKKKQKGINVRKNVVLNALTTDRLVEEASSLNPIMDIEKNRTLTPKGLHGVNLDQSYSIDKRAFDPSFIGTVAISSSPDANVGKVKQLTYEPMITSTMGYIEPADENNLDKLKNVNLLSASELLSPPGVLHDDGPRTSMAFKQSKFMVPVPSATPVIVGNRVESAVAYQVSDDFVFKAKDSGTVVDIKENYVVVKYDNGKYDSIDLGSKVMKNSSNGFWLQSQMTSKLKKGDKFEQNEILAIDDRWFRYNINDKGASMNIGTLCNIAILVNYDEFEDSIPITQKFANKLQFDVIEEQSFNIGKNAYIQKFPKVGDKVKISESLVLYDKSHDDPDVNKFLNMYRDLIDDSFVQANMSRIKSEYNGEIVKIEIVCTCELDELSPTLREIVEEHYGKLDKRIKVLDKYANAEDVSAYKCGQVLVEVPEKVETTYGKIKGKYVGEGIRVSVFIKRTNIAKKGDKLASYTALKGIISDVIEEGYEPIALDTNKEVDAFISPLAILARKVPSIEKSMFSNKCMIELTRQLKEFWMNN